MKINERLKFEIVKIEKLTYCDDKLVYCINTSNSEELLFETKKQYETEYDNSFKKTNMISGLVEFINYFNNKIVITNIRFLKKTDD